MVQVDLKKQIIQSLIQFQALTGLKITQYFNNTKGQPHNMINGLVAMNHLIYDLTFEEIQTIPFAIRIIISQSGNSKRKKLKNLLLHQKS